MHALTKDELTAVLTIKNQETVHLLIKMYVHETLRAPSLYAKRENAKA